MTAHWGVPDPAQVNDTPGQQYLAFADTFRMLSQRISIFVNLPIASLSKIALQERLDDIGRVGHSTEPA
jgi:hypothetical protein